MRAVAVIPFALALLWGLNWPAIRLCLTELGPWSLRTVGLGLGALILFAIAAFRGTSLRLPRDVWRDVFVVGLLTVAVFNISTAFAQLTTTTSRAAILTFTFPIWSTLGAALVLGERLDQRKATALVLAALGIGLLALPVLQGAGSKWGLVFPILAALGWAAGTIYQKKRPVAGDRLVITAWQLVVGAVAACLGLILSGETPRVLPHSGLVMGALAFHIVLATALAYLLWFTMLARLPASTSALTTLMIPVIGVLSAMALVGDRPVPADWIGFAAILAAAALIMLRVSRSA
jgi:drug/metabolite transporter (DMT)-like permease